MNESWDSEHNKKLLLKMPSTFAINEQNLLEGKTHFLSFAGENAFLRRPPVPKMAKGKSPPPPYSNFQPGHMLRDRVLVSITDGTSNTLIVAEGPTAVEWTKPEDHPFVGFAFVNPPPTVPKLGGVFAGGFHGLMGDGAVHFFPDTLSETTLRAMITPDGGEIMPPEVSKILFPNGIGGGTAPPPFTAPPPLKGGTKTSGPDESKAKSPK
jgi:hypothetical protein